MSAEGHNAVMMLKKSATPYLFGVMRMPYILMNRTLYALAIDFNNPMNTYTFSLYIIFLNQRK
jgi:hypothetical protein